MIQTFTAALIAFLQIPLLVACEDKIAFAYEMIRHGARSPGGPDPLYFKVAPGMLTNSGMRQRYLQGRFNRQKYVEQYGLLDSTYNPSQIFVQSTGYLRTL